MQTSVPELTDFSDEPQHVLDMYGPDVHQRGTFAANALLARVDTLATEIYGDDMRLRPTGYSPVYAQLVSYVLGSQRRSLLLTAGVIFFMLLLMLRGNWRLALLSLGINLLPVVLIQGRREPIHGGLTAAVQAADMPVIPGTTRTGRRSFSRV